MTAQPNGRLLFSTRDLLKKFPGIVALNEVSFDLNYGEVHGIVGENGAGKSTFCNVVCGIYPPDGGEIYFEGVKQENLSPQKAIGMGIRMVYQERNLVPQLTGVENICLNNEPRNSWGVISSKSAEDRVNRIKAKYNIDVETDVPVSTLSASKRQLIEIIRAIFLEPKMLILDEPTSSLSDASSDVLFRIIAQLKSEGVGIIYISHKLDEVFSLCDRISVFRDGKRIVTDESTNLSREVCISLMAKRELDDRFPEIASFVSDNVVLELKDVSDKDSFLSNINLKLYQGEVLGLYGLVGAGRTELAQLIFGIRKTATGQIRTGDWEISPGDSVNTRVSKGIYMLPEDRMGSGLFTSFTLAENISVSSTRKFRNSLGVIDKRKEKAVVSTLLDNSDLELKYQSLNQSVESLSGGNKQKLLIARIYLQDASVIVLDEPTVGIDVGTKYQIYELIRELANQSKGVIVISSELPELIGICDRMYIMKEGKITGELQRSEFSESTILTYCF